MRKLVLGIVLTIVALVAAFGIVIAAGMYNVAADDEHTGLVYSLLETARDRSIATRAAKVQVPDLADPERVRRGAGNYDAMCVGCHLRPSGQQTEISQGLYPEPPKLSAAAHFDPARAFWVIKHGIKATGMPAWGESMEDQYIWDMVAFLRELPGMDAERYAATVEASEGHSHGGGESAEHEHEHEHGDDEDSSDTAGHSHEAGSEHSHSHAENAHAHDNASQSELALTDTNVLRTVQDFHSALSAGDASAVSRLLDPAVLIMEGGSVERSREEYAGHHLKSDVKFMRSVKYTLERQTGDNVGDLAWVASEAALAGESQGKRLDLVSTESLVLKRSNSGWRIVHIHWSSRERPKV
jgi:ketosteroid isomerase-like protein/mono/diheme cytochrome c family protein